MKTVYLKIEPDKYVWRVTSSTTGQVYPPPSKLPLNLAAAQSMQKMLKGSNPDDYFTIVLDMNEADNYDLVYQGTLWKFIRSLFK